MPRAPRQAAELPVSAQPEGYIDLDPAEALVRQLSPLDAAFVYGETPTSPTGSERIRRNQDMPLGLK